MRAVPDTPWGSLSLAPCSLLAAPHCWASKRRHIPKTQSNNLPGAQVNGLGCPRELLRHRALGDLRTVAATMQ